MTTKNAIEERPLPEGWIWTTIGEITQPIKKVKPQDVPDKAFIYLDISGVDNDKNVIAEPKVYYGADAPSRARQVVKSGDVLFSTVRTYLKNIAQVPEKYDGQVASTGFAILRGVDGVNNKYLFYYSLADAFLTPLGDLQRGTSYPAVRDSDVREQTIPLAPLPEQERIVAEIEKQFTRLDTAVATLRHLQAHLDRYKASVLKAACEGRLVPQDPDDEPADQLLQRILAERRRQWQEQEWQNQIERAQKKVARRKAAGLPHSLRDLEPGDWQHIPQSEYADYLPKNDKWKQKYEEPEGVDAAELRELPDGWVWTRVEQLADVLGGLTKNSKRSKLPLKMPYLRVANVYANQLELDSVETIGVSEGELNRVLLEKDDLLIVEGNGSIDQIGRVALWDGSIEPCVHQNHIIKARFVISSLADFILYWLLSPGGRKVITEVASSTSGLYTLSLSKVNALPVPLPPLNEQKRIVEEVERRLSVITATQQVIDANLTRAGRLRHSILQQAFSGRLVSQPM